MKAVKCVVEVLLTIKFIKLSTRFNVKQIVIIPAKFKIISFSRKKNFHKKLHRLCLLSWKNAQS